MLAPALPASQLHEALDRITNTHYGGPSPSSYRAKRPKLLRGKPPVETAWRSWTDTRAAFLKRVVAACLPSVVSVYHNERRRFATACLAVLTDLLPLKRRSRVRRQRFSREPETRIAVERRPDPQHLEQLGNALANAETNENERKEAIERYRRYWDDPGGRGY